MTEKIDVVDALAGLAEDLRSQGNFVDRLSDAVAAMQKERDEARAEIDRLRSDVAALEAGITAQDEVLTARYNKQLARSETAYQRGAEAMREAAADLFQGNKPGLAAIPHWSAFIRALPIPEDKP